MNLTLYYMSFVRLPVLGFSIFSISLLLSSVSHGNKFPPLFFKVIPSLYVLDPIFKISALSVFSCFYYQLFPVYGFVPLLPSVPTSLSVPCFSPCLYSKLAWPCCFAPSPLVFPEQPFDAASLLIIDHLTHCSQTAHACESSFSGWLLSSTHWALLFRLPAVTAHPCSPPFHFFARAFALYTQHRLQFSPAGPCSSRLYTWPD